MHQTAPNLDLLILIPKMVLFTKSVLLHRLNYPFYYLHAEIGDIIDTKVIDVFIEIASNCLAYS